MRSMGKILTSLALGSIGLGAILALSSVTAPAATLLVEWTEPSLGISASWEQSSTPTPISYASGAFTDVPIFDFTSTGSTPVGPYSDIFWYSNSLGGLFDTPDNFYAVYGAQAYSGDESAPTFLIGVYPGTDQANGDAAATVTIASVPELSTWAMMFIGFGGLSFLGYRRSVRLA
jgi:hypothetical protein